MMEPISLFWPMAAMVAISFAVQVRLYVERIGEMKERRIHPQKVATQKLAAEQLTRTQAADHFRNLFEMPLVFHAGALAAIALALVHPALVALAWAFVAARAVHAVIHLTYNRVMHRFVAYLAGSLFAWLYWATLVWVALSR